MRAAVDTNILAYAERIGNVTRWDASLELLDRLPPESVLIPAQVMGELFRLLTSNAKCDPDAARRRVLQWTDSFEVADSRWPDFQSVLDLTVDPGPQILI